MNPLRYNPWSVRILAPLALGGLLACGGSGGGSGSSGSTTTAAPAINSFSATPSGVVTGKSTSLTWTVSGATSLSLDHGIGDVTGKTSQAVSPTATTTYTLTATNSGSSVTKTATVTVDPYNYVAAYDSGLQGKWIRACWEASDGALATNFSATAPGMAGTAVEVHFGAANGWNAFGLANREPDWSKLYFLYLNEFKAIEFDVYFQPDSTGEENLGFILEDAGHSSEPGLVSFIPGWASMTPAQKRGHWFHVKVDLAAILPDLPRFEQFLLFNGAGGDVSQPHFLLANVKLGWLDDTVAPVVTQGAAAANLTYTQLSIPFTTDKPTVFHVEYGISDYGSTLQGDPADWSTSHTAVLTGLQPDTTYQYRIVAVDHRTDPNAVAVPGLHTASFAMPAVPTTPPTISGLAASGVKSFKAVLGWTTDRPCTEVLSYQKAGGAAMTRDLTDFATDRSFVLDLLEASAAYTVTVQATDAFGHQSTKSLSVNTPASGSSAVDVAITADGSSTKPISPLIYGTNQNLGAPQYTFGRMGGDLWTTYNWTINACNAGQDWYNWNYDYLPWYYGVPLDQETKPGIAVSYGLDTILGPTAGPSTHADAALITVPVHGNVAADNGTDPNEDVSTSGANYLQTRFKTLQVLKGAPFTLTPSASDPHVYTDEFVNWVKTVAKADHPGKEIFYSLDNEPDIWFSTHKVSVPQRESYDSFIAKETAAAKAIKGVDSNATVFGLVSYGWYGYTMFQGSPDGSNSDFNTHGDFTEYYLDKMKQAETSAGKRLVDVLDLHYYTSALSTDGKDVGSADASPTVQAARVQSTRSLWDPTFVENSWIPDTLPDGDKAIRLLPRMQAKIDAKYPGTKLAITEYNFQGGADISGAIAEADALGLFGQYGLFAATRWEMDTGNEAFEEAAFKLFRGFDGANANFGDVSVMTSSSDPSKVAVYVSQDSHVPGRVVIVAINRATAFQDVSLTGVALAGTAKVYRMTAAAPQVVPVGQVPVNGATWYLSLPPMSVSTIEVQ